MILSADDNVAAGDIDLGLRRLGIGCDPPELVVCEEPLDVSLAHRDSR